MIINRLTQLIARLFILQYIKVIRIECHLPANIATYAIKAIPRAIELNIPKTITPVLRSMQKQHFGKHTVPSFPLPILD